MPTSNLLSKEQLLLWVVWPKSAALSHAALTKTDAQAFVAELWNTEPKAQLLDVPSVTQVDATAQMELPPPRPALISL